MPGRVISMGQKVGQTLVDLAEDNDTWEAGMGIVWDGGMVEEDA